MARSILPMLCYGNVIKHRLGIQVRSKVAGLKIVVNKEATIFAVNIHIANDQISG